MSRHQQTFHLVPVPADVQAAYRRLGMTPPVASSGYAEAATWPHEPRIVHRVYARVHGYFWMPCVLCEKPYGGHEIHDNIPDPTMGEDWYTSICPACSAERNGGQP